MEYKVIVPKEYFVMVKFKQNGKAGMASLNQSLVNFEPKQVFGWHLSIMLHLKSIDEYGLPDPDTLRELNNFEDGLDLLVKGTHPQKVDSLFLARIAWNSTVELVYRVHEPQKVNDSLQGLLARREYPIPYDFRIDPDVEWKLAEWHLKNANIYKGKN